MRGENLFKKLKQQNSLKFFLSFKESTNLFILNSMILV